MVGIDGCKYGWVAVMINADKQLQVSKHRTFDAVISTYPAAEYYLTDMVIGLADEHHLRTLEKLAREKLKPHRTSTVFTPPCRAAVYEKDYESAKQKNKVLTQKSISIQAWNIVPKIIEVDQFLQHHAEYKKIIIEAHPEVCFASLNQGSPMFFKKNIEDGEQERTLLFKKVFPEAYDFFKEHKNYFLKKDVKPDDFLDALCLAVTGHFGTQRGLSFIRDENHQWDSMGLEIRMAYVLL